jgi:hypothetical protein
MIHTSLSECDVFGLSTFHNKILCIGEQLGQDIQPDDMTLVSDRFDQQQGLQADPTSGVQTATSGGEV